MDNSTLATLILYFYVSKKLKMPAKVHFSYLDFVLKNNNVLSS